MQGPSSPAPPLVHTSALLVCAAGRVPTVAATPGRPGEARLQLEAAGAGYGVTVMLVGPAEILAQVVADLDHALQAAGTS